MPSSLGPRQGEEIWEFVGVFGVPRGRGRGEGAGEGWRLWVVGECWGGG